MYLKQRLKDYRDCSIGGYAFGDKLKDSEFYELAVSGPEIFGYLYLFSDQDGVIIDNFIKDSTYYQYEYLVPIEEIYFTNYDELSNQEKQYHILVRTLQRLYFYKYDLDFNLDDNEIMSIVENKMIRKRQITYTF